MIDRNDVYGKHREIAVDIMIQVYNELYCNSPHKGNKNCPYKPKGYCYIYCRYFGNPPELPVFDPPV